MLSFEDRWPSVGDKMIFINKNGYTAELEHARTLFVEGDELTVKDVEIGNSSSRYLFEESKSWFNSVMFDFPDGRLQKDFEERYKPAPKRTRPILLPDDRWIDVNGKVYHSSRERGETVDDLIFDLNSDSGMERLVQELIQHGKTTQRRETQGHLRSIFGFS